MSSNTVNHAPNDPREKSWDGLEDVKHNLAIAKLMGLKVNYEHTPFGLRFWVFNEKTGKWKLGGSKGAAWSKFEEYLIKCEEKLAKAPGRADALVLYYMEVLAGPRVDDTSLKLRGIAFLETKLALGD